MKTEVGGSRQFLDHNRAMSFAHLFFGINLLRYNLILIETQFFRYRICTGNFMIIENVPLFFPLFLPFFLHLPLGPFDFSLRFPPTLLVQITSKNRICIQGVGGPDKKEYEIKMKFLKELDVDASKYAVRPRSVDFALGTPHYFFK